MDSNYISLKEKIFSVLNDGLSIVTLADKLECTPSALQLWLEGDDDSDLSNSIYSFLIQEKIKDEILDIPVLRITPFNFIENVIIESRLERRIYALIGNSGLGKTACIKECLTLYENIRYIANPDELEKLSLPVKGISVLCLDNAEELTARQAELICRINDEDVGIILAGEPKIVDLISHYNKLPTKTLIRDIPGIDNSDVKMVLDTVIPKPLDEDVVQQITVISIPSIARLVLLLKESYRLLKKNKKSQLDGKILSQAKKSLIILEGSKW